MDAGLNQYTKTLKAKVSAQYVPESGRKVD